jgi:hypothetical protein
MKSILYFFINKVYFNLYYNKFYELYSFIMSDKLYSNNNYVKLLKKSNILNKNECISKSFIKFLIKLAIHHSNIDPYNYELYYCKKIKKFLINNMYSNDFKKIIISTLNTLSKKFKEKNFKYLINYINSVNLNNKNEIIDLVYNELLKIFIYYENDIYYSEIYNLLLEDQDVSNIKIDTNEEVFLNNNLELSYKNNFYSNVYLMKNIEDDPRFYSVKFKKNNELPKFIDMIPILPINKNKDLFKNIYSFIYIINSNKKFKIKSVYKSFNLNTEYYDFILSIYNNNVDTDQKGGSSFNIDDFIKVYLNNNADDLKKYIKRINSFIEINEKLLNKKNKILYKIFLQKLNNDSLKKINYEKLNLINDNKYLRNIIQFLKKI